MSNEVSVSGKSMGYIFVRQSCGTYIARFRGKKASCTAGEKQAAEAVARKWMGKRQHVVKQLGGSCCASYTFEVMELMEQGGRS